MLINLLINALGGCTPKYILSTRKILWFGHTLGTWWWEVDINVKIHKRSYLDFIGSIYYLCSSSAVEGEGAPNQHDLCFFQEKCRKRQDLALEVAGNKIYISDELYSFKTHQSCASEVEVGLLQGIPIGTCPRSFPRTAWCTCTEWLTVWPKKPHFTPFCPHSHSSSPNDSDIFQTTTTMPCGPYIIQMQQKEIALLDHGGTGGGRSNNQHKLSWLKSLRHKPMSCWQCRKIISKCPRHSEHNSCLHTHWAP